MCQLTVEHLVQVLTRLSCFDRLCDREVEAVEEAIRRVPQHERLVAEVLPELRRRLSEANDTRAGGA
jgi:hypothetical protein